MAGQWMLDTNTVILFFKGNPRVVARMQAQPLSSVAVSTLVVYELAVGVEKSTRRAAREAELRRFLGAVPVVPFGVAEAEAAARVRATLERQGRAIGPMDTLVAGAAVALGATLVTNNTREFGRVAGLAVEDWTSGG